MLFNWICYFICIYIFFLFIYVSVFASVSPIILGVTSWNILCRFSYWQIIYTMALRSFWRKLCRQDKVFIKWMVYVQSHIRASEAQPSRVSHHPTIKIYVLEVFLSHILHFTPPRYPDTLSLLILFLFACKNSNFIVNSQ